MSPRIVKLLHIEDDVLQQRLVARKLSADTELRYEITFVEGEDAATAEFARGCYEFVLLDYQLSQGDGLSCLRKLRAMDEIVPIIVLSGTTPQVATELLRTGADDYLSKCDLAGSALLDILHESLERADLWRRLLARDRHDRVTAPTNRSAMSW
jgi:DNA-binding response OmpR family regulator